MAYKTKPWASGHGQKADTFLKVQDILQCNQDTRAYKKEGVNISPQQITAYEMQEQKEHEDLLARMGGKRVVKKGYENKSPLCQVWRYEFDDGTYTQWF